ncbi:MAG: site-2 protease family protein [Ktedonobacteraceae bacterium]|nr:site-2 protease family protein [Ktedonobacteraceae bacterium]
MNNWYLLAAIPVFGLLVLVHEFGHFITAKWAGIRVEEFGLGFPPRLVGFRKRKRGGWEVIWFAGNRSEGEDYLDSKQTPFSGTSGGVSTFSTPANAATIYSLNLIPIGGFVRMPGENGDIHDPDGNYDPQSFAAKSAGKRIIVLCAGVTMNVLLAIVLFSIANGLPVPTSPAVIGQVVANSPAAQAGLRPGDTFIQVNGHPVKLFSDVQAIVGQAIADDMGQHATVPVNMLIQHKGDAHSTSTTVNVRVHPPAGQGPMGIDAGRTVVFVSSPIWQAPLKGIAQTFELMRVIISQIGLLVVGAINLHMLTGPVGIVKFTGQVAQTVPAVGLSPLLSFTAFLSLNLAIINILPFPALDGGRVLLVLIEVLRGGKRLKPEREGVINLIGMAILLTLVVIVTINDVFHWGS